MTIHKDEKAVFLKSMNDIMSEKDFDTFRSYEEKKYYEFWSISRKKFVRFSHDLIDRYFGTGRRVKARFRDDYRGIKCYRIHFDKRGIMDDYIVYEWMFEDCKFSMFFEESDFLI